MSGRSYLLLVLALLMAWPPVLAAAGENVSPEPAADRSTPEKDAPGRAGYGKTPERLKPYSRSAEPYRSFYLEPLRFFGPGRDVAEPVGSESVRIGLIAPLEEGIDAGLGRNLRDGVALAVSEANASGGYRGLPFEVIERNDQAIWGSSSNTLVDLAYLERVWAVIGSVDSNSTHVALRAALKAEVMIVNVGSTDPTVTETGIPWLVRCTPDDRQTGYLLALHLFEDLGFSRVAVLRSTDRYGRFGVAEFRDAARRLGRPLPLEILFESVQRDFAAELERIEAADIDAVVLWTKAEPAALIVRQMRARGMRQLVAGPDRLASPGFLELAGESAEGVIATRWIDPERQDAAWIDFERRFSERFTRPPDAFSAYGYDAANLVIDAVRAAGLNRLRIRDRLMGIRSVTGVAGTIVFDETSNNIVQPYLVSVKGGRFAPL
ncbi:MAG: ABC transporter substrate-binding protein [Thermoanaerobaculia bacterium]